MRFQVRALQGDGQVVTLAVDAASPEAAVRVAAVAPGDVLSVRRLLSLRS